MVGNEFSYTGINGSKLHALGKIKTNIITSDVQIDNVDFYVVSKDTISFDCLLGRDFMNRSDLNFFVGNTVTVNSFKGVDNFSEASKEIMAIAYVETHETTKIRIGQAKEQINPLCR